MPYSCAVAECTNTKLAKRERGKSLLFHAFPKDKQISEAWENKCNRQKINIKHARICSDHFITNDYERDLQGELLGLTTKQVLKKNIIPSIFPGRTSEKSQAQTSTAQRSRRKQCFKVVSTECPLFYDPQNEVFAELPGLEGWKSMEGMSHSQETGIKSDIPIPAPKCLTCGAAINSKSQSGSHCEEMLTKLFHTFSKCMCWKIEDGKMFEFRSEIFPFCPPCISVLESVYDLNVQLETIQEQLKKLVTSMTARIVLSQEEAKPLEDFKSKGLWDEERIHSENSECEGYFYNSKKVGYFRGITLRHYLPHVALKRSDGVCWKNKLKVPGVSSNSFSHEKYERCENDFVMNLVGPVEPCAKNNVEVKEENIFTETISLDGLVQQQNFPVITSPDFVQDSDNFFINENENFQHQLLQEFGEPASYVHSRSSYEEAMPTVNTTNNLAKTPTDSNLEWWGTLKHPVRKLTAHRYIYNERFIFEEKGLKWVCFACEKQFNHVSHLEPHFEKCRSARKRTIQKANMLLLPDHYNVDVRQFSWSNYMKKRTRKVGRKRFLFDNTTEIHQEKKRGVLGWLCCSCQRWIGDDKCIERHVIPGCKVDDNPALHFVQVDDKNFQFKGFEFHKTKNGQFKCNQCYYTAKTKARMVDHISGIHIRQLAIASISNEEVGETSATNMSKPENMDTGHFSGYANKATDISNPFGTMVFNDSFEVEEKLEVKLEDFIDENTDDIFPSNTEDMSVLGF